MFILIQQPTVIHLKPETPQNPNKKIKIFFLPNPKNKTYKPSGNLIHKKNNNNNSSI